MKQTHEQEGEGRGEGETWREREGRRDMARKTK